MQVVSSKKYRDFFSQTPENEKNNELITKIVIAKKYNLLKENEHQLCMSFCNE